MALKFGPQWLRDLSDTGTAGPPQPPTPTLGGKFKLADYRYGREEMLALYNDSSPPPDQVRKHQSIFSKDNQKPIAMSPLTKDEQGLMSQGFNSTGVMRAAVRGSAPPLRGRGGGTADRGRGRGRGRGEGYISRVENGDPAYGRLTQDGWEHVGRKFERSFSRGYDDPSLNKREFSRSSSDNWRDKRAEEEKEEVGWRTSRDNPPPPPANRWGPSVRPSWRDQQDYTAYDGRRPPPKYRESESDIRGPRRISENYDNDEVPEWVEDDIEDDPGTFDSSGMFVAMKTGRHEGDIQDKPKAQRENNHHVEEDKEDVRTNPNHAKSDGQGESSERTVPVKSQNGNSGLKETPKPPFPMSEPVRVNESLDRRRGKQPVEPEHDGVPKPVDTHGSSGSPAQLSDTDAQSRHSSIPSSESFTMPSLPSSSDPGVRADENFLHMEKSLQNLIAEMSAGSSKKIEPEVDVAKGALPLTHENANKWFYRDPQGEIQGPFQSEDMAQWFSAGYFAMSLIVKRGCDDSFKQLGELIKRYGRVPFLPGPPLPPLITATPTPEEAPQISTVPPLTMPSLVPHLMPGLVRAPVQPIGDPLVFQQFMAQQEYIKQQTFMMHQMQMQTLSKLQEQESFKMLSTDQQQHLTMQMMVQTNPLFMQQFQQLQHQILLQQQQLSGQPQVSLSSSQQPQVPLSESHTESSVGSFGPALSHPSTNMTSPPTSFTAATTQPSASDGNENGSVWAIKQQSPVTNVWPQPTSLWDIDDSSGPNPMNPAYMAQLEKKKIELEEQRLQEEERTGQEEMQRKAEDLRRQEQDIERQREQVQREKEELERQTQLELQKLEEVRRQEEERLMQEIERQKQEKAERERIKQAEEKKRQEEEKKRAKELKKQEEKRRKEDEKQRRLLEEQQREQEELRQRREEEELQRQQELEREAKHQEELERQLQIELEFEQLKEEEERMEKETREKESQRKLQLELKRQQESLRRLQQQQKEQLANMQLPASSNWAKQQSSPRGGPVQSKSLTEIQEEETQKEREKVREQHSQMQMMQAQAAIIQQQNQQKSWATHARSQGIANRGLSLLDIQQQEQESARKTQKEREKSQNFQAKISQSVSSTWSGNHSSLWGSQSVWDNSNAVSSLGPWDHMPQSSQRKNQSSKESNEFPALKIPNQQAKKNAKSTKKTAVSKQKKEEESVQKLFEVRQQDGFTQWVTDRVSQFSAQIDVPTFVSFIVEVDSPDDVRDYVKTYLGESKECKDFARQFVEKRSQFRNQARLEKQLEEDSIWGPAPAINPRTQLSSGGTSNGSSGGGSGDGGQAKAKARKKKQKMQKMDGSVLGFTVHADPNRKNAAGEFESIQ